MNVAKTEDVNTCLALRRQVFIEEQGVSEADEVDGRDPQAVHFLAQYHGAPLGTARVLVKGTTAKVGRVCVLAQARGTGMGQALIRSAVDWAKEQGLERVELGAQVTAIGFYQRLGFTAYGPVYDDAGIDHKDMELTL